MANLSPIQLTPAVQANTSDAPSVGAEEGQGGFSEELQGAISLKNQKSEEPVASSAQSESTDAPPGPQDLALQILPLVNWVPGTLPANFASPNPQAAASSPDLAAVTEVSSATGLSTGLPIGLDTTAVTNAAQSTAQANAALTPSTLPVGNALPSSSSLAQAPLDVAVTELQSVHMQAPVEATKVIDGPALGAAVSLQQTDMNRLPVAPQVLSTPPTGERQASSLAQPNAPTPQALTEAILAPSSEQAGVSSVTQVLASDPGARPGLLSASGDDVQSPSRISPAAVKSLPATTQGADVGAEVTGLNSMASAAQQPTALDGHAVLTSTASQVLQEAVAPVSDSGTVSASLADNSAQPAGLVSEKVELSLSMATQTVAFDGPTATPLTAQVPGVDGMLRTPTEESGAVEVRASAPQEGALQAPAAATTPEGFSAVPSVPQGLARQSESEGHQKATDQVSGLDPLTQDEASGVKAAMTPGAEHQAYVPVKAKTLTTEPGLGASAAMVLPAQTVVASEVAGLGQDPQETRLTLSSDATVGREMDAAGSSAPMTTFLSTLIGQPVVAHARQESAWLQTGAPPHPMEPHQVQLDSGQVQVEILRMVKQGGGQVVMELTPPDQSKFKIDLQIDAQGQATLIVEGASDSTRTRLEQGASGLQQQFAEMGLQLQLDMRQSRDFGARQNPTPWTEAGSAQEKSGATLSAAQEETRGAQRTAQRDAFEGNVHLYA